jgi:peptidoglycan/xylan/chitin deacetylase (PgdA/CDA1 family)
VFEHKTKIISLMRSSCVRAAASAAFYSGIGKLLRPRRNRQFADNRDGRARGYSFAVLLYHRVNPDNDPFFPALSVKAFEAQIKYLAANYTVLSLADIIERIRYGRGLIPGTIAVTFDDGYRDNYLYAHPILQKYNLPATLFAATSYIGTDHLMWNDKIALAVKLTSQPRVAVPGLKQSIPLATVTEKLGALERITETLKTLPETEKRSLTDELFRRLYSMDFQGEPVMLSWAELRKLAYQGWEVGSHTANHVILTRVPLCQAKEEISASGAVLEQELDRPVRLFAYPNGKAADYDSSIKRTLAERGYLGAVTTIDRLNTQGADLFAIGRTSPWEQSLPNFALKLAWNYRSHHRG